LSIKLCLSLPLKNKAEILLTYLSIKKWTIAPNVGFGDVPVFAAGKIGIILALQHYI